MKPDPIRRESVGGWVRLGLGTFLVLVLPVWSILTASFLQAQPFEEVLVGDADGTLITVSAPPMVRFFIAGSKAAGWLGLFLGLLGVAGLLWWVAAVRQRNQAREAHARYASASPEELDLSGEEWEVTIRTKENPANKPDESGLPNKMAEPVPAKTPPVR